LLPEVLLPHRQRLKEHQIGVDGGVVAVVLERLQLELRLHPQVSSAAVRRGEDLAALPELVAVRPALAHAAVVQQRLYPRRQLAPALGRAVVALGDVDALDQLRHESVRALALVLREVVEANALLQRPVEEPALPEARRLLVQEPLRLLEEISGQELDARRAA